MQTLETPACDYCGEPATNLAQDLVEIEPVKGSDGKLWADWKGLGDPRYGCDEHPAVAVVHERSGHTQFGPTLLEQWAIDLLQTKIPEANRNGIL